MRFSIVIPARDEAAHLGACMDSIASASRSYSGEVETIVVLNRCTDSTEVIALSHGARIVHDDSKNLSKIRNAGARVATGHILVTIDADSRMSANMLVEIDRALTSGKYIGGAVPVQPERWSLGIALAVFLLRAFLRLTGLAGGLFWCFRRDFEAVSGFNEELLVAEDLDFAKRLKAYGRRQGKAFVTLRKTHIVTSCRKFDAFGDWFVFRYMLFHGREVRRGIRGQDRSFPDRYFYDFNT